jgi:DNA polymerase (family 10)
MPTRITNREVARIFATVADLLQLKGENIHRVLAYRRAAETVADLPRDLYAVRDEGALTDLPYIGATLAEKIEELLETGELDFFNRLAEEVPIGLVEVMDVPGMGPKRAAQFWQELGITSIDALREAAEAGQLRELPGMGEKSEANILQGIELLSRRTDRLLLGDALPLATGLLDRLLEATGETQGEVAGSLRRRRPTIGDIDLLIASENPEPIMDAFAGMPEVASIHGKGSTKTSVELHSGQQVDLRVLPPDRWGTLLVYFTGSADHNVHLRELALKQGLSLNEHAFTPVEGGGPEILCATEEAVYAQLNMPWIPPELREDTGEIEAALAGTLPDLITLDDMRGDLQCHTTWSDGKTTVLEMAQAAQALGYDYLLITDHSHGLGVVQGLTLDDIDGQRAEIDAANEALAGAFTVLHGVEVEIKADGALDYNDETLAKFDIVQASLHVSLRQPREQVTARMVNAIRNPYVRIIGHPRGLLLGEREPADLDMDAVFEAAREHDVALEINANPHRLDLDGPHARRAVELGVKLTISTDAHRPAEFHNMPYGVATARRGWVTAASVVNTWPLRDVLAWAKGRR